MSTVIYLQGVRHGEFNALMRSVHQPVNAAKAAVLEVYGAAQHVDVTAEEALSMTNLASELEAAARNLRNAASTAPRRPAMHLMAAE